VTGPADRPAGSPGSSPGRPPEHASFEPARIAGRRLPPALVVVGFVGLLGAFVTIGVVGRMAPGAGSGSPPPVAAASTIPTSGPGGTPASPAAPRPTLPIFAVDDRPPATSGPGLVEILAKRHPETVFVHGDVFVPGVTWVFVSVRDDIGNVAGWASVSVPGAAGPGATAGPGIAAGPTLRFDVELALRGEFAGRLWVQAQAYEADGHQVAFARVDLSNPDATP
jgi:hypothetical protein